LYEVSERRAGENLAVMRDAFQAITDRRPVDFRDIKAQEQTDLTADQRRESRSRSPSADTLGRQVSVGFESVEGTPKQRQRTPSPERERQLKQVKQQLGGSPAGKALTEEIEKSEEFLKKQSERDESFFGKLEKGAKPTGGLKLDTEEEIARKLGQRGSPAATAQPEPETETKRNVPIETIEQTTKKGRDVKLPKRFEEGATEAELAEAGGIEGKTPASRKTEQRYKQQPKPQTTARGGTGTKSVERQRPKLKAGEVVKAGKQGGVAPLAKKAETKPTDTSVFGSSPAGKAFAEEVKRSEEALRKAKERGK